MKVLLYVSSLSLNSGGPSRSVPMMAKGLSEAGLDVVLMTQYSDDMNTHALDGTNVQIVPLKYGIIAREIDAFFVNNGIDIVQLQSVWSLDYHKLAKICRRNDIPYLITPRGMLEPWSLSQKKWKKQIAMFLYQKNDLNHAAYIYTTSDMEARHVRELGIKTPCSVIPNGIEIDGYPCRASIDKVKKQVLFLSRIHVKKGIELLIDAWVELRGDYPDWELLIVGNGDKGYIDSLIHRVNTAGLQDSIKIKPPVFGDAKVEFYQSSSLFVLPSYSENFGMVIAEAMSCGVPVITSNNTPWEVLNGDKFPNKIGWCISLSHKTLLDALREAMSMPSKDLYEMGQRASIYINDNYNYRLVTDKTLALYKKILSSE